MGLRTGLQVDATSPATQHKLIHTAASALCTAALTLLPCPCDVLSQHLTPLVSLSCSGPSHGSMYTIACATYTSAPTALLPCYPVHACVCSSHSCLHTRSYSSGDLVTLCRSNPLTERTVEAVVYSRGRYELLLAVDEGMGPYLRSAVWR